MIQKLSEINQALAAAQVQKETESWPVSWAGKYNADRQEGKAQQGGKEVDDPIIVAS